jgi:hypothetical protein
MSNEKNEIVTQASVDEAASLLARGDKMLLQQVRMGQGLSKPVQAGLCRPGEFYVGFKDTFLKLGNSFKAVVSKFRPHALLMIDGKVDSESFDPKSEVFKKIEAEANGKKREGRRPMFGLDFLFYLPECDRWAVYFFAKTARRNAKPLLTLEGKVVEISAKKIENAKYTWFVPEVIQCVEEPPVLDGASMADALSAFMSGAAGGGEDEEESATTGRPR